MLLKEPVPKADLVKKLKEKNKTLQKEYNHLVDTNVKVLGNEYFARKVQEGYDVPIEIYSTAHSRSTKLIYEMIDEYLKRREAAGEQMREGGQLELEGEQAEDLSCAVMLHHDRHYSSSNNGL